MSKFKVGDKVRVLSNNICFKKGDVYTINEVHIGILDGKHYYRKEKGVVGGLEGEDLEPVEETKPLTNTIITDIKDEVQHDRLVEKLISMGYKKAPGYSNFIKRGGNFFIQTFEHGMFNDYYSELGSDRGVKHITASEFLQEVDTDDNVYVFDKIPNGIIETKDFVPGAVWRGKGVADKLQELHNYKMPEVKGANKTNMNNIVSFFNDLTVSAEDKELRKAGLKNTDLNWTEEAKDIVKELEAKELGYINYTELKEKTDCNGLSPLEYHALFTKYYTKLLDTAKKFNKRDEKKTK